MRAKESTAEDTEGTEQNIRVQRADLSTVKWGLRIHAFVDYFESHFAVTSVF